MEPQIDNKTLDAAARRLDGQAPAPDAPAEALAREVTEHEAWLAERLAVTVAPELLDRVARQTQAALARRRRARWVGRALAGAGALAAGVVLAVTLLHSGTPPAPAPALSTQEAVEAFLADPGSDKDLEAFEAALDELAGDFSQPIPDSLDFRLDALEGDRGNPWLTGEDL